MGNISGEMKMFRRHQKKMLGIRNTIAEMKNACNRLHSGLDKAREGTSATEDRSKCTECRCVVDTTWGASE